MFKNIKIFIRVARNIRIWNEAITCDRFQRAKNGWPKKNIYYQIYLWVWGVRFEFHKRP